MYAELLTAQLSQPFVIKSPDKKLLGDAELMVNANQLVYLTGKNGEIDHQFSF